MTLGEAIRTIDVLPPDHTIFARRPWTANSEAALYFEPDGGFDPRRDWNGFDYFLEVFIARDLLEDWAQSASPTAEEKIARTIYYAGRDA